MRRTGLLCCPHCGKDIQIDVEVVIHDQDESKEEAEG